MLFKGKYGSLDDWIVFIKLLFGRLNNKSIIEQGKLDAVLCLS